MTDTRTIEWYKAHFDVLEKSLNGESYSALHATRKRAIAAFAELGFPTTKNEEWRFTNVGAIAKAQFAPVLNYASYGVRADDITQFTFGRRLDLAAEQGGSSRGLHCSRLVFLNGHFASDLSELPAQSGVKVGSLKAALKSGSSIIDQHLAKYVRVDENAFTALNTAFIQDGAFIDVADTVAVLDPIHLIFIATGDESVVSSPRNLIIAGKGSKVSIVESYVSLAAAPYLTNAATEFVVGEHAIIEHDKLQDEAMDSFHIGTVHFQQSAHSNVISNAINFGGAIVRSSITVVLNGEGIESTLNGLSLSTGTQLIDNHTTIDHAKPHCASHEVYKAILDGKSKGVFNGKIFVRKDAQKTDAKQTNKTLLLSDEATIDTKPQLEIFADDVKCTHGATVGHLDEEQLFYLRSRGIGKEEANDLLTFAFASDVINRVHIDPLREQLDVMVHEKLQRGRI